MEAARLEQSICIYAAMWAGLHTYGMAHANTSIHEAAQEADLIILWGTNLVSMGVHAIPFIREAQERGAKLIVIDPRRTSLASKADSWLQGRTSKSWLTGKSQHVQYNNIII